MNELSSWPAGLASIALCVLASMSWAACGGSGEDEPTGVTTSYVGRLEATTSACNTFEPPDTFALAGEIDWMERATASRPKGASRSLRQVRVPFGLELVADGSLGGGGLIDGDYQAEFRGDNGFSSAGEGAVAGRKEADGLELQLSGVDVESGGRTRDLVATFSGIRRDPLGEECSGFGVQTSAAGSCAPGPGVVCLLFTDGYVQRVNGIITGSRPRFDCSQGAVEVARGGGGVEFHHVLGSQLFKVVP